MGSKLGKDTKAQTDLEAAAPAGSSANFSRQRIASSHFAAYK